MDANDLAKVTSELVKEQHLIAFQTSHDGFGCDECGKRVTSGTTLNGCRSCDFDMCGDCFAEANESPSNFLPQVFHCPSSASTKVTSKPVIKKEDAETEEIKTEENKPTVILEENIVDFKHLTAFQTSHDGFGCDECGKTCYFWDYFVRVSLM
jgi:hypothetical protein